MQKTQIPFGAWEPDAVPIYGAHVPEAVNVIPAKGGYRPWREPAESIPWLSGGQVTATADGGIPRDIITYKDIDDTVHTVGVWNKRIFSYESGAWVRKLSYDSAYSFGDLALYGGTLYAIAGDTLHKAVSASTIAEFTAVADAPHGAFCEVVKDFLVVGQLTDNPRAIRWSGIDAPDSWPAIGTSDAVNAQSDIQTFPEGGKVQAVVPAVNGADAIVFLETAVQRMDYVNAPYIFQFTPVDRMAGLAAPKSAVNCGSVCVYLSSDGWMATDGQSVKRIGMERIDRWFFDNADPSKLADVQGCFDPRNGIAVWRFVSSTSEDGFCDRLLIYSPALDRFSTAHTKSAYLWQDIVRGKTLEDLDVYGSLEAVPFGSLDDNALRAGSTILGTVTRNTGESGGIEYRPCTFSGRLSDARITTTETGDSRMMVLGIRPLVDGGMAFCSLFSRPRLTDRQAVDGIYGPNRFGICPFHRSGRYFQAQVDVGGDEGNPWTFASGLELFYEPEGGE